MTDPAVESYRPLLFSIAYRMLGSVMDAEDIVQEAYLRYHRADPSEIASPKAWLTTIVTRLCINQLNSARHQRESYIGPWLPEPLLTDSSSAQAADQSSIHESISMAFLVMLEQLSAAERAVFLLREIFDFEYDEIAVMIEKSEEACRQLFSRAKKHILDHRPRFDARPEEHLRMVQRFIAAVTEGDVEGLTSLLAQDVVVWTDGGGKVFAARQPIYGRELAARFILGTRQFAPAGFWLEIAWINGQPAIVIRTAEGQAFVVILLHADDTQVKTFYIIGNPDKLRKV